MSNFEQDLIIKYVPKNKQKEALEKLASGYPVQYIIGDVDFYGTKIKVNENVLIPRFETEYLVSDVITLLKDNNFIKPKVIDFGTGSGCIAIALKKNYDLFMDAMDISHSALKVAKENAKLNNVVVNFFEGDIFDYHKEKKYDVILSNPPYVPVGSYTSENTKYEPQNAIFADDNGLKYYKKLLKIASKVLNKKSLIAFEIGDKEGNLIKDEAMKYFPDSKIIIKKDLNNFERYFYLINE